MSLFRFAFFFLLSFIVSYPAISTARLAPSRTQSCVTPDVPLVNEHYSNMRFHDSSPTEVVNRTPSFPFRVLHLRNGKPSCKASLSDAGNPASNFRCVYLSYPPADQSTRFLALLTPTAEADATSHHSRGIRRPQRRLSCVLAPSPQLVREVQLPAKAMCTPSYTSRLSTCEGLVRDSGRFRSPAKWSSFLARTRLSPSFDRVRLTSSVEEGELLPTSTIHQAQAGGDKCESFFSKAVDFRTLPETLRPSTFVSSPLHGNYGQSPPSNAGTSPSAFASSSSGKSFPSSLVALRVRTSPQTSSLHAASSATLVSSPPSPLVPQPSIHFHISSPSVSSPTRSANSPSSALFSFPTVTSHDSFVPASVAGSAEAPRAPKWPPWLPYGLPPEGILPQHIAESTSAASLQHAKKVFLDLLQSGRLTRCPSSAASVLASSDAAKAEAATAGARRRAEDQETENEAGGRGSGEEHTAARGEETLPETENAARASSDACASATSGEIETAVTPTAAKCADPPLGEEQVRIFAVFAEKYVKEVALSGRLTAQAVFNILASTWQLAWKYSNYPFTPYHKALRTPLDFSTWSEMMWRPLVDFSRSKFVLPVPEKPVTSASSSSSFVSSPSTSDLSPASPSSPVSASSPPSSPPPPSVTLSSAAPPASSPFADAVDAWSLGGERTPAAAAVAQGSDTSPCI